jgi:hypothetical protein
VENFNDWDNIPADVIARLGKPVLKTRTRTFEDLKLLALNGLTYHWGRNLDNAEGKNISINSETYEVYVTPINTTENSLNSVSILFNTNGG